MRANAPGLIHKEYRMAAAGAFPGGVIAVGMRLSWLTLVLKHHTVQGPSHVFSPANTNR